MNLERLLAKGIVVMHQRKWWTLNMNRQWWSVIKGIWCTVLYKGTFSYNGSIYWLFRFVVIMGIKQSSAAQIWLQCVRNPSKIQLYDAQMWVNQRREGVKAKCSQWPLICCVTEMLVAAPRQLIIWVVLLESPLEMNSLCYASFKHGLLDHFEDPFWHLVHVIISLKAAEPNHWPQTSISHMSGCSALQKQV